MANQPTTALDALVAELLGDVGRLNDQVKALNEMVPAMATAVRIATAEAETRIAAVTSTLEKRANTTPSTVSTKRAARWLFALALVGCGAVGGLSSTLTLRAIDPTALLTGDALQTYRSGQWIERAYKHLDPKTRAALESTAQATQE